MRQPVPNASSVGLFIRACSSRKVFATDKMHLFLVTCLALVSGRQAQNFCCPTNDSNANGSTCNPELGLNCSGGSVYELDKTVHKIEYFVVDEQTLIVNNGAIKIPSPHYCLTMFVDENRTLHELALICINEDIGDLLKEWNTTVEGVQVHSFTEDPMDPSDTIIVAIFCCLERISMAFFLITLIIYIVIPQLHDLEGHCSINFLLCYSIVYLTLNILCNTNCSGNFGFIKAHFVYFFSICSFCWFSIIIFNIWKDLSCWCSAFFETYLSYIAYAYGIPTVLTLTILILLHCMTIDENMNFSYILTENTLRLRYFYAPIIIVVTASIFCIILTASLIHRVNRNAVHCNSPSTKKLKWSFYTYSTLFLVIALTWLLEIIFTECQQHINRPELFFMIDVLNSTQGILTFGLLIVSRKQIRQTLIKFFEVPFSAWKSIPAVEPMDEVQQRVGQYLSEIAVPQNDSHCRKR